MAVRKNKLSQHNREFWEHVENLAERVRREDHFSSAFRSVRTATTGNLKSGEDTHPTNEVPQNGTSSR